MNWYTLVGMFFFVFWCSLVGMPWTVRRCLACHRLADLILHAIDWHTLDSLPLAGIAWLACHELADLERHVLIGRALLMYHWLADAGWYNMDWQTFVVSMPLYLPANCCQLMLLNYALQAVCPLVALFPTICTISNYLHYFQLFATTLPNDSQLFALFTTIHKLFFPTVHNYLHYYYPPHYLQLSLLIWSQSVCNGAVSWCLKSNKLIEST